MAALIALVDEGKVSNTIATQKVFTAMLNNGDSPEEIAKANNWIQESDSNALQEWVDAVVAKHPEKVVEYKKGKKGLIGLFMGEVMKLSKGNADHKLANQLVRETLEKYLSKVYFASDLHLGVPDKSTSLEREKLFVRWLNEIQKDAEAIYLLGDIFDFWFEYKKAIPKGYTRLLGKLSEIADSGIPIYFFTGNHDMWAFDYLKEEVGIKEIYRQPIEISIKNKKFYLGHGDGLGPGDSGYKILKSSLNIWVMSMDYS